MHLSKFTCRIAEAPLPEKLKLRANVGKYDGTEDCTLLLELTLTGAARLWFDSLPPGSIDNYEEMRDEFLKQFQQKKKVVKNPNEILHITRRDDEKVKQFMERFITESMQIQGVPEVMKISSFING
ncbi:hypothetical protein R6Q59_000011, partial [Mikania micrantha]